jgi:hypothetical protein
MAALVAWFLAERRGAGAGAGAGAAIWTAVVVFVGGSAICGGDG